MHFQAKYPQAKLLRCSSGKIFDVAVDIRKDSSYFGKWVGVELSDENKCQLYIPKGFAHGYYVLSETADISYKCSDVYYPNYDSGIIWNDPDIGIEWPSFDPILSNKDLSLPSLNEVLSSL